MRYRLVRRARKPIVGRRITITPFNVLRQQQNAGAAAGRRSGKECRPDDWLGAKYQIGVVLLQHQTRTPEVDAELLRELTMAGK